MIFSMAHQLSAGTWLKHQQHCSLQLSLQCLEQLRRCRMQHIVKCFGSTLQPHNATAPCRKRLLALALGSRGSMSRCHTSEQHGHVRVMPAGMHPAREYAGVLHIVRFLQNDVQHFKVHSGGCGWFIGIKTSASCKGGGPSATPIATMRKCSTSCRRLILCSRESVSAVSRLQKAVVQSVTVRRYSTVIGKASMSDRSRNRGSPDPRVPTTPVFAPTGLLYCLKGMPRSFSWALAAAGGHSSAVVSGAWGCSRQFWSVLGFRPT